MTGLHWASKKNHFKIAQVLLEYKADVDAKDIVNFYKIDWTNTYVFCSIKQ